MPRDELAAMLGFGLSDEQWEAVSAPLEPFAIVAGAGTGKTTVMAARVLWLVASSLVGEHEVLGLTFTNKAASELATRVRELLAKWRRDRAVSAEGGEPRIVTYHSFARSLLSEQGLRIGLEPGAPLLSEGSVMQLAYRLAVESRNLLADHPLPVTLAAQVVKLDAELAEQAISPERLRGFDARVIRQALELPNMTRDIEAVVQTAARRFELALLVDELRARKWVRGVDFADQMRLSGELVSQADDLARELRRQYRVVLLDEYQDTSIAQRMLLAALFAGHPVTAVGDPLQAIYGWRSASVANLDGFGEHFAGARGRAGSGRPRALPAVRVLRANRRSGAPILAAANDLAADLRSIHRAAMPLVAGDDKPAEVRAALLETAAAEREWVVGQITDLIADGTPPADIAVLTRVGADVMALRDALAARGVPASPSGREALLARPEVAEVVRTLQVLADPLANQAIVGLLAGPRWRLGPRDLAVLAARAEELAGGDGHTRAEQPSDQQLRAAAGGGQRVEICLLEAVWEPGAAQLSESARERLVRFAAELRHLQTHLGETLVELTHRIIDTTGADIAQALTGGGLTGDGLGALLDLVAGFADADGKSSLGAFASWLELVESLDRPATVELSPAPNAVQLMTVHKAKGLEWPVVFLPHLTCRIFPSERPSPRWTTRAEVVPVELRDDRHVLPALNTLNNVGLAKYVQACREHDRTGEDRLGYVAFTRARRLLVGSGHWWGSGKAPRGPSDYLRLLRAQQESCAQQESSGLAGGESANCPWADEPQPDPAGVAPENPLLAASPEVSWPARPGPAAGAARDLADDVALWRARLRAGAQLPRMEHDELRGLDADIESLRQRRALHAPRPAQPGPLVFTAGQVQRLLQDPAGLRAELRRPMPAPPRPSARRGEALHAWIEGRLGYHPLITDDELPGAADGDVTSDDDLLELKAAFENLPYAGMVPHGLEVPFAVPLGGVVVRGRIDAVFRWRPAADRAGAGETEYDWEVVDWKTSHHMRADAMQLAIYRLAWAHQVGVPPTRVLATFAYLRSGRLVRPQNLPDAAQLGAVVRDRLAVMGVGGA